MAACETFSRQYPLIRRLAYIFKGFSNQPINDGVVNNYSNSCDYSRDFKNSLIQPKIVSTFINSWSLLFKPGAHQPRIASVRKCLCTCVCVHVCPP